MLNDFARDKSTSEPWNKNLTIAVHYVFSKLA